MVYKKEFNVRPTKINCREVSGLTKIPPELWKARKFDDILIRSCNAVYRQSTIEEWTKYCFRLFPKKSYLRNPKNYRGITFIVIVAKAYSILLLNRIKTEIEKILRKKQKGVGEIDPQLKRS